MNVYDSDRMIDVLAPLGYVPVDEPEGADMVILNTCHIREKAAEKVYSDLGRIRRHKDAKATESDAPMLVAVAGCVAQAEGGQMMKRAPVIDMVFGPQTYHRLPEMIARAKRQSGEKVLDTDFPVEEKFDHLPVSQSGQGASAFLTVQEGCDKFCTFCVVPYTRGAEFSRPVQVLIDDAARLAAAGTREITLLGQNVNAYHGEDGDGEVWSLGRLLRRLAEIEGVERLRYTTSHPLDVDADLIAVHRDVPEVMPFLHLPVQSGADRVLRAMNRKHTAGQYRVIVDKLRAAQPDLQLSSDFIVGFPAESDRDFQDTLQLIRDVGFIQAYSFKYSPRPGTPASAMDLQVEEHVKAERLAELQAVLSAQQQAFNDSRIGARMQVLFDRTGKKPGQLVGRSPFMQPVFIDGAPQEWLGDLHWVDITAAHANSLTGRVVAERMRA